MLGKKGKILIIGALLLLIGSELAFIQKKRTIYKKEQIQLKKEEDAKKALLEAKKEEEKKQALAYDIYPIPQKITYQKGTLLTKEGWQIETKGNVSKENEEETRGILKSFQQKLDGKNTLQLEIDEKGFETGEDPYQLEIKKNKVLLKGKDNHALYYGLQSFQQLLQKNPHEIYQGVIEDYGKTKLRGVVEGFYGIPWTFEERKSLMNFMGKEKMNTFIFAPKNDAYHNEKWREAYPEDKLAELQDLVTYGNQHHVRLVWTIHPFMFSGMRFDGNYQKDLDAIIQKFESLYAIGVRQFGVLADDIYPTNNIPANQIKLLKDLEQWNTSKKDNEDLLFVPAAYNGVNAAPVNDIETFNQELPENIHIFWTGRSVLGHLSEADLTSFQDRTKKSGEEARRPYFWLNWPTNDWNNSRLFMGEASLIEKDVIELPGLVSNPMPQGEASKLGLFQVADYAWHPETFEAKTSWEKAFSAVEPTVPQDLKEIAYHLKAPMPNRYDLYFEESENIQEPLQSFLDTLNQKGDVTAVGQTLIQAMDALQKSIVSVKENASNKNLVKEMDPWLVALNGKAARIKALVKGVLALNQQNVAEARLDLQEALQQKQVEKTSSVQNLDGPTNVEVGQLHLEPFSITLENYLSSQI